MSCYQTRNQGAEAPPRKIFAPPRRMCCARFKNIGHSSKNLDPSRKTLRPSWCPKVVTGLLATFPELLEVIREENILIKCEKILLEKSPVTPRADPTRKVGGGVFW